MNKVIQQIDREIEIRKSTVFPSRLGITDVAAEHGNQGEIRGLILAKRIIQSETEEICISKERLACILIDYAEYVEDLPNGWACDQTIEDALEWLNQKEG